jgi:CRP-like cAMP-binding protein
MTHSQPELLRGLSPEEVEQALSFGTRVTIARGTELFRLGDPADRLFVVERGRIRLTLPMQVRGQEEDVLVEERSPGQTVGWSALIPPYRFTLTATAPLETELIAFSREALAEHFAQYPSVGYVVSLNLAAIIGQRLQLFQTMWLREMQRTVELRCA